MKFEKKITMNVAFIPGSALKLSGLTDRELELHTSPGAVALIRKRMTAMELVETIEALGELTTQLIAHLTEVCGTCDDCGEEGDPCPFYDSEYVDLPDYLRAEAGIPQDAKLCASADEDAGAVTIFPAGYTNDLRDVPAALLDALKENGVCLGELEEHLIREDVVYG